MSKSWDFCSSYAYDGSFILASDEILLFIGSGLQCLILYDEVQQLEPSLSGARFVSSDFGLYKHARRKAFL